jgi:predicted DCC family thiol-disulfide oxidoreductase YuxK
MQASFVRHLALAPRAVARHTRAGARLGGVRTFASAAGSVASAPSSSSAWDSSKISWDVRVLYDGDCPLCVREVDFLRGKDGGAGRLDLVDIASDEYDPDANAGIPFETAMSTIHGIKPSGDVITGIEVFERAYAAVGLGWVYAFAKVPSLLNVANKVYDFWAERRMQVTGRGTLAEVLEIRARRMEAEEAGGAAACSLDNREACDAKFD